MNVESKVRADALPMGTNPNFSYENIKATGTGLVGPSVEFLGVLNPVRTAAGLPGYLVQADYDAIFVGKTKVIFTHGRVTYSDIFGREHWTDFCFRLDITSAISWNACEEHNEIDKN